MNIFVTDECPKKSAVFLDNTRVIKMILESAQLLSTAIRTHGGEATYKATHIHHPCTKWTAQNADNYQWVLDHFLALLEEYTFRTGKTHACSRLVEELTEGIRHIPPGNRSPFVNCARRKDLGIDFTHVENTCEAYRIYLKERWKNDKRAPKWTNRS